MTLPIYDPSPWKQPLLKRLMQRNNLEWHMYCRSFSYLRKV